METEKEQEKPDPSTLEVQDMKHEIKTIIRGE